MTGPGIFSYSTTPASNVNANTGINWDEGMAPASVNNSARQNMTDLRNAFNDLIWFRYGKGDLDYSPVYVAATQFKIAGADVTATYQVGRRVKVVGSGTGTIYGRISVSSFSTDTTVTCVFDSGSLSNETLTVYLSQAAVTGKPISFLGIEGSAETTWTPSLGGNTTYNSQSGRYIRIGNIIVARYFLDINTIGTGSATAISGLPVTSNATLDGAGSPPLYFASLVTSVVSLSGYVAANSTVISFSCLTAAAASMTLAPTLFQNSSQIKGQVVYAA